MARRLLKFLQWLMFSVRWSEINLPNGELHYIGHFKGLHVVVYPVPKDQGWWTYSVFEGMNVHDPIACGEYAFQSADTAKFVVERAMFEANYRAIRRVKEYRRARQ